jgi:DNA-binding transcriptional MerR regulator
MQYGAQEPVKKYYSISEVAKMLEIAPHVLRYWEQEFTMLRPMKNRAGNRTYREVDIELLTKIKHLLYVEKYTIDGAMLRLQQEAKVPKTVTNEGAKSSQVATAQLHVIQSESKAADKPVDVKVTPANVLSELQAIKQLLKKDKS